MSEHLSAQAIARKAEILADLHRRLAARRARRVALRAAVVVVIVVGAVAVQARIGARPGSGKMATTSVPTPPPLLAPMPAPAVVPAVVIAPAYASIRVEEVGNDPLVIARLTATDGAGGVKAEAMDDDELIRAMAAAGKECGVVRTKGKAVVVSNTGGEVGYGDAKGDGKKGSRGDANDTPHYLSAQSRQVVAPAKLGA